MARIDVEIEDYLDEVESKYLVEELSRRKGFEFLKTKIEKEEFRLHSKIKQIQDILGLQPFTNKEDIINEIKEL